MSLTQSLENALNEAKFHICSKPQLTQLKPPVTRKGPDRGEELVIDNIVYHAIPNEEWCSWEDIPVRAVPLKELGGEYVRGTFRAPDIFLAIHSGAVYFWEKQTEHLARKITVYLHESEFAMQNALNAYFLEDNVQ